MVREEDWGKSRKRKKELPSKATNLKLRELKGSRANLGGETRREDKEGGGSVI